MLLAIVRHHGFSHLLQDLLQHNKIEMLLYMFWSLNASPTGAPGPTHALQGGGGQQCSAKLLRAAEMRVHE